jgi:hypothetical protein
LQIPPNYGTNWTRQRQFVGPKDSIPLRDVIDPYELQMADILKVAERGKTSRGNPILVIYGLVEYTDGVTKENYRTPFCYRLERDLPSHMGGKLVPYGSPDYLLYT